MEKIDSILDIFQNRSTVSLNTKQNKETKTVLKGFILWLWI